MSEAILRATSQSFAETGAQAEVKIPWTVSETSPLWTYSGGTDRWFTCNTTGTYHISASIGGDGVTTSLYPWLEVSVVTDNGTNRARHNGIQNFDVELGCHVTGVYRLTAGQKFHIAATMGEWGANDRTLGNDPAKYGGYLVVGKLD